MQCIIKLVARLSPLLALIPRPEKHVSGGDAPILLAVADAF